MRSLFSLAFLALALTAGAQDTMPIVAYRGVPQDKSTAENYRNLKDCGFNTSVTFFDNESKMKKTLALADSMGMMVIPHCGAYFSHPDKTVPQTDSHSSLLAYLAYDEPNEEDLPTASKRLEGIRNAGAKKPCYVNLFPYYGPKQKMLGTPEAYRSYLRNCISTLGLTFLSFDNYPILNGDSVRYTWYDNLSIVRDEARRAGIPVWAFVRCAVDGRYKMPTLAHLRLQVNMNLAYGAQAIQYYTYWQLKATSKNGSPVDSLGKKTLI